MIDRARLAPPVSVRASILVGVLAYILLFQWAYVARIVPVFESVGFTYRSPGAALAVALYLFALIPSVRLPIGITRPSEFLYWVLYLMGYIPGVLVPMWDLDSLSIDRSSLFWIDIALFAAFTSIGVIYRLQLPRRDPLPRQFSRRLLLLLIAVPSVLTYVLGARYFASFSLVGLADVGDLKDQLTEAVASGGPLFGYLMLAQMHAINPLLLALGIHARRSVLFLAGAAGQAFFYLAAGVRAVLLSPVLLLVALFTVHRKGRTFGLRVVLLFLALPILMLLLPAESTNAVTGVIRLLYWRTLVIPAQLMGVYFDFFRHNPLTHMAQVKGFSWFIHNPYSEPIPIVVAESYYGKAFSANANFFAEGYAALAIPGLFVVAGVVAGAFYVLDWCARHLDLEVAVMAVAFQVVNLVNLSIFTALLGSGFALSMILLALCSPSITGERDSAAPEAALNYASS